jgi:hypothetical protein
VDGIKEAAWDGMDGQTPGVTSDVDEAEISDGYDIKEIRWTNDDEKLYFLIETFDDTNYYGNYYPVPTTFICLDTDQNPATGSSYSNCNNMTGIDRSILFNRMGIEVYNGVPGSGTLISSADAARMYLTTFTEVSVNLESLGLDSALTCIQGIQGAVYFDNGVTDSDDHSPNSGTFTMGCGAPTAIELANFSARSNADATVLWGAVVLAVLFAGCAAVWLARQKSAR